MKLQLASPSPAFRAPSLIAYKRKERKITALTAYDYTTAALLDRAGVDLILVGDSLSSIIQGEEHTLAVTMDEMVYHCRCVAKGVRRAMVVGDLPFLSYHTSPEQALENAGRLVKEAGVQAVKLEGGIAVKGAIEKISLADIPVIAHVGLTPQSLLRIGKYKVQGKTARGSNYSASRDTSLPGSRERIIEDALAAEEAGALAVVLECIPAELAKTISNLLSIPTIGIGAGPHCDGQILVTHDMLGLNERATPKFVERFCELGAIASEAIASYIERVQSGAFPGEEHSYSDTSGTDREQVNTAH